MIALLDKSSQVVGTFESNDQLIDFLQGKWRKLGEREREDWRFMAFPHKMLATIIKELKDQYFSDMAQQACLMEQDLILLCVGDAASPRLFLETPDLNLDKLWEQWSWCFCDAHGLKIVDEPDSQGKVLEEEEPS